jgi:hypothetical protein
MAAVVAVFVVGIGGYVAVDLVGRGSGNPIESGPDEAFLMSRLGTELPAYIRLRDLRVEASQNVGDLVEPLFKTRFSATIELTVDTFLQAAMEEGVVIVVPHLERGVTRELYGLANSALSAGAWKTVFAYDNDPHWVIPETSLAAGE